MNRVFGDKTEKEILRMLKEQKKARSGKGPRLGSGEDIVNRNTKALEERRKRRRKYNEMSSDSGGA